MDKNKDLAENTDKAISENEEYIRGWDEEVQKIVNMAWEQWNLLKEQIKAAEEGKSKQNE